MATSEQVQRDFYSRVYINPNDKTNNLLLASTSLLCWDWFGNSLGTSVGLIHLVPLGQESLLKIRTVVVGNRLLRNNVYTSSEMLVHWCGNTGLFGLCGSLGTGLGDECCTMSTSAHDIDCLGIGQSRALETGERLDISLFERELDRSRTSCATIRLSHKRSVLLSKLPYE